MPFSLTPTNITLHTHTSTSTMFISTTPLNILKKEFLAIQLKFQKPLIPFQNPYWFNYQIINYRI